MAVARFNPVYHWLVLSPVAGLLLANGIEGIPNETLRGVTFLLRLATGVAVGIAYYQQRKYIRAAFPQNSLWKQTVLILAALLVPAGAFLAGDLHGAATFGSTASSSVPMFGSILLGAAASLIGLWLCAIGNIITILTNRVNSVLGVLGNIAYVLLACSVFVVSYFAYAIAYTLRDPSTE